MFSLQSLQRVILAATVLVWASVSHADRTFQGYVGGGTTCFYLADVYQAATNGAAGEYERTKFHRQFKVVARGNKILNGRVYDRVYNLTEFQGGGLTGSSRAKIERDAATGKIKFVLTVQGEDENKQMKTVIGESELLFTKGNWDDYQKGMDVEWVSPKNEVDGYIARTREIIDYTWQELHKDFTASYASKTATVGPLVKGIESVRGNSITLKGNLKQIEFVYPTVTTTFHFDTTETVTW